MILHTFTAPPPLWLGEAMEAFERQFTYPLGAGGAFHVSHGRQYVCFFQAMGDARVLVMEREGVVLGTVAVICRPLRKPDGGRVMAYYVCDLKVAPGRMAGPVLARLLRAVKAHVLATGIGPVYGIVMGGTARTPGKYTGRLGIPEFVKVGELAVLRLPLMEASHPEMASRCREATWQEVETLQASLTLGAWVPPGGNSPLRSEMQAVLLVAQNGGACGAVEDTRLGKRLVTNADGGSDNGHGTGSEMKAAHLSRFAFRDAADGLALVRAAMHVAAQAGFPALFLALPENEGGNEIGTSTSEAHRLKEMLVQEMGALYAPATVYGAGVDAGQNGESGSGAVWWVDTAEI